MKPFYLILFISFLFIKGFSQNHAKDNSEAFKLIEVWLDAQKDFEKLPGITAAVVGDQEVLWSGAFGLANVGEKVKMEPSTLFSICSISKLFTSVAIMKLYDEGKLRLDDRIEDLLPWYDLEQKFPDSGPVTIRSLLTHSSGLPREANFPYWTGPDFPFPTSDQVKEELSEQETLYPASQWFQYSNLGMTLLGEVVEEVSGISYDEYIRNNIIIPLGLTDTLKRNGEREKVNFFQANGIKPAAGFTSNVMDLGKFASWQFRLMDTTITEILKPSTLKYMHNVHWTDPDWKTTWGLGFMVFKDTDEGKLVGHGGSCPGYRSVLRLDPKSKKGIVVMVNAIADVTKYATGIDEILDKLEADQKKKTSENEQNTKDLKEYSGYYSTMPWSSELFISEWNGHLISLTLPSDSPVKSMTFFKHIESDTFRRIRDNGEPGETLVFERNEKGEITQFKQHGNYSKKINH
jgi:CubicO group peptidase (beta-lactamase class C family)